MDLLFEKSVSGRNCSLLPECDVAEISINDKYARKNKLNLPELSENDISRHYSQLESRTYGVNNGFYPLGSCTMKYNPKINEKVAALPGFTEIHPLQPVHTVQGCLEVLHTIEKYFCTLTGLDTMTFKPAAGAHGEFTGITMIRKYHESRGDFKRTKIIVPDSAHGTNPATAAMCGMTIINIPSGSDGCVDLDKLRAAAGPDTAAIMLTNPNTLGIFEKDILEITRIIHEAGGLCYYDGANLNAIMGIVCPGDMGFDYAHLNLHKTFATPHGGGGPGSGGVGCKAFLEPFLPTPVVNVSGKVFSLGEARSKSIGRVKSSYGNFLVVVRALTYMLTLGGDGLAEAARNAVLNANYFKKLLGECYEVAYKGSCMHEFVVTLEKEAKEKNVTAMDIAKLLIDNGIHPPTMYFPLIVNEALMIEPTETESKEMLDWAAEIFLRVYKDAMEDPEKAKNAPVSAQIRRPDELKAARNPVLRYTAPTGSDNN